MTQSATILYTLVDEAPALATYSLFPILRSFTRDAGVTFEQRDISLAGRILANFPDYLQEEQRVPDALAELGELVKSPDANVIKLPNISASVPQLTEAIAELRSKGFMVPEYPESPTTDEDKAICARYAKVLGSAVNPVLREGNSDRRAAASVKRYGLRHPHQMMKPWSADAKTRVASMTEGDFYGSEKSVSVARACKVNIELVAADGAKTVLKENLALLQDEIIDASVMHVADLAAFYEKEIEQAKRDGLLLSLHLKATMMKVSDPVLFGHCVRVYYRELFEKYGDLLAKAGVDQKNGVAGIMEKLQQMPDADRKLLEKELENIAASRPQLAMVDAAKGISNLHRPNNVIIDASMPVVVRDGGKMWGADNALHETVALIPDRCYAGIYSGVIDDCRKNGAFDPATMGAVANVGLMAQKAEEYGSHDKTFIIESGGVVQVVADDGAVLMEQPVAQGDIFRMCQTKDAPIKDWVGLAVSRARIAGEPAIFWLDENRAHDRQVIARVQNYLGDHDLAGLDITIQNPSDAMKATLQCVRKGQNAISVTGNVLRDYLTDLFPILELGTSARMLSIVPLMNGGGLFETGAGGSAPKHVQQFLEENHLRWDSLGEFCALVASFEHLGRKYDNPAILLLAETLDQAVERHLEDGRMPSRHTGELDNRGSHFYLALYWAEALAAQQKDAAMAQCFAAMAGKLRQNEDAIMATLNDCQGGKVDIGGYYRPNRELAAKAMRPSAIFNEIVDGF